MKPPGPYSALCAALFVASLSGLPGASARASAPVQVAARQSPRISTLNGFVQNRGQWDPDVLFFARVGGVEATLLRDALVFRPSVDPECMEPAAEPLVLRLPGSAESLVVEGAGELPTLHHFILASGRARDVRGYESVVYRDVQPGIDVRMRFDGEHFAYDLLADPGAQLAGFEIAVEGAQEVELADSQKLLVHTGAGVVEQRIGASWQEDSETGEREALSVAFRVLDSAEGAFRIGFEAPGRDPSRALVIDPSLTWATYVGGPNQELLQGMAVDAGGAVYLVGSANLGTTPTTPGAFMPAPSAQGSLWIGKLSADGSTLEWGTFLGGSDSEQEGDIEVDSDGTVVVVGKTWSADFPTTEGSLQPVHGGNGSGVDIFVTRLDPSGSSLVWSTFIGQTDSEDTDAMTLMPSGDVVVSGHYLNGDDPLPGTPDAFDPVHDVGDGMVFRISADGSSLVFLTYFIAGAIRDIVTDEQSSIYFAGLVGDEDAPFLTTPGAFKEVSAPADVGGSDGFVAKMNPTGSDLLWATLVGGNEGSDTVWGIALDAASAVYVVGQTSSDDFPVTAGAFDLDLDGATNGFVTKLLPGGSNVAWSTYLGSGCACGGTGYTADVDVDAAGNAHVAGWANQPGWPTTVDAFQPFYIGPFPTSDSTLTKLDVFGEALVYSTWFGGGGTDNSPLVALDGSGHPHLGLNSSSTDLVTTPGVYQPAKAGSSDLAVAKFDLPLLPWRVMGGGLAGTADTPSLAGTGALTANSPTRISVRGAFPSSIGWFFIGFTTIDLPFLGGTLVPWPNIYFAWPTDTNGAIDLPFSWPGLAPGSSLYFQYWVIDPGAPELLAATAGLQAIAQAR